MTTKAIRRSEVSSSLKEKKRTTRVVLLLGEDGPEGAVLNFWDDPEMLSKLTRLLQGKGAEIVEVEEDFHGDIEEINSLAEELILRKNAGEIRCGDSNLLSNVIPNLVIKALKKSGRL